jgi:hypothetical protein
MHVRTFERHVYIADRCTAWKVISLSENLVLRSLRFQKTYCLFTNFHAPVAQATIDLMIALWGINLMLALNCLLLNRL